MLQNKIIMVLGGLLLSIASLAPSGTMNGGGTTGTTNDGKLGNLYKCPSSYTFKSDGNSQKLRYSKISASLTSISSSKKECRIGCKYQNDLITINVDLRFKANSFCELDNRGDGVVYY